MDCIIEEVKEAVCQVYKKLNNCNLEDASKSTNEKNETDDEVIKIDDEANKIFESIFLNSDYIKAYISEENTEIKYNKKISNKSKYIIACDPIDGSKNIDINITTGSIFSIFKENNNGEIASGRDIVCSGYSLFGICTQLIISTKNETNLFQLNKESKFIFIKKIEKMPEISSSYSINQGYQNIWNNKKIVKFIENQKDKVISLRFVGSMVADVHRAIIKGGNFLYPGNKKNKDGKLRLLYEVMPMAYIFENLGGNAIDDYDNKILDLKFPDNIHQRSTILLLNDGDYDVYKNI